MKKTYKQQWHEYNLSQTREKLMFMHILSEITQYVEYNQKRKIGRPRLNKQEMVYCMCMLLYSGKSTRRIISELHLSKQQKMITHVPHFNSILNYFNNATLKNELIKLIELSSLPLKEIEQDFAVDSTGFTTSVFGRWFDKKWGKNKEQRKWRKAHVMCGTKTNIITSVQITQGTTSDTKMFPELVERTSRHFQMREVSADLAYSSRNNMNLVQQKGAIPYIPFKKNTTGHMRGSMIWRKMYNYFSENNEEYMKHYHKRSNVETVFSMMKRKLGMHLRTKTEQAQDIELLCKVLCHNIFVLIHEIFELKIDLEFEKHMLSYCAHRQPPQ